MFCPQPGARSDATAVSELSPGVFEGHLGCQDRLAVGLLHHRNSRRLTEREFRITKNAECCRGAVSTKASKPRQLRSVAHQAVRHKERRFERGQRANSIQAV